MSKVSEFITKYGVERLNTDSVKWDHLAEKFGTADLLPMWVADMEFKVPEAVQEAMTARINHGVFGYTVVPDSYYEAFFSWQQKRYQVTLEKDWVRFSPGVVSSFYWMINAYTKPLDRVLILSPVYYPFYDSVKDTNRHLVTSNLINQAGVFTLDFEDIERKIIENKVKLFIHCSPHNPVGRVWTKAEQEQLFDICLKHDVLIVADEIHQDLTRPDSPHVAALALAEAYQTHLIVLNAPSKTFNMACLLNSHIIIPNERLRRRYDTYAMTFQKSATSLMGITATEAAYRHGSEWLEGLIEVIEHNYQILSETFTKGAPKIVLSPKEGTYLAWLDLRAYLALDEVETFMQEKCGLATDYGEWFGEGYRGFIRINLGTDPDHVQYAATKICQELAKITA